MSTPHEEATTLAQLWVGGRLELQEPQPLSVLPEDGIVAVWFIETRIAIQLRFNPENTKAIRWWKLFTKWVP